MPPTGSALRRSLPAPRTTRPIPSPPSTARSVDSVLRGLPSHGWTSGWVGRRDRALLVLSQQAGLSYAAIAGLTVDDIVVKDGTAIVRTEGADPVTLRMTDDCLLCGPCALSRWLHALDLAGLHTDGRVVASVIARAAPLTAHSPHVCEGTTLTTDRAGSTPVFPADDRWATTPSARPGPAGPVAHSGLPAPSRPVHDLRTRAAHGARPFSGPAHTRTDVTRLAGTPAAPVPADGPTTLEIRARALLSGLG